MMIKIRNFLLAVAVVAGMGDVCAKSEIKRPDTYVYTRGMECLNERNTEEALDWFQKELSDHPIGYELLPQKFSLKDLQSQYERILESFDRRNFSKKMFHMDTLTQLDETMWPTPKREANLYRANLDKYTELIN